MTGIKSINYVQPCSSCSGELVAECSFKSLASLVGATIKVRCDKCQAINVLAIGNVILQ